MSFAAATSFSNEVINLSREDRSGGPFRIRFGSDWRNNGILDWYHSPGPRPTKINTLQLRRERSKAVIHQYIVLILSDDCILRLDRRCDEFNLMDAVKSDGTESIDTIVNADSLSSLDKTSYCLAELQCQASDVDLLNVIKICFGIHGDDKAGRYTLQCFNCYFIAWTIFLVIARHAVPWDKHPFDSLWETLSETLANALSTKLADALMDDGGLIMIMAIYSKLNPQLSHGVSRRARLAWAMPQWLPLLPLQPVIRTSWRSEMHTLLRVRLQSALHSALQPTLRSALADLRVSTLRTILWKDNVGDAIRVAVHRDVTASILDATANALSSIGLEEDADAFQSVAETFADRDLLEGRRGDWGAAFIAWFNAIVQATLAANGADNFITDDAKWEEVWNSIRDTIGEGSKEMMEDVEGRWATLRDGLMEGWVAGWEVIRPTIRDTARDTVKEMADLVSDALAYSVVKTLPDTDIGVRTMLRSRLRHMSNSRSVAGLADVTHSELQPYMLKFIREHGHSVGRYRLGSPAQVEKDMREAMGLVWTVVVELDRGGANANSNRNVDLS